AHSRGLLEKIGDTLFQIAPDSLEGSGPLLPRERPVFLAGPGLSEFSIETAGFPFQSADQRLAGPAPELRAATQVSRHLRLRPLGRYAFCPDGAEEFPKALHLAFHGLTQGVERILQHLPQLVEVGP